MILFYYMKVELHLFSVNGTQHTVLFLVDISHIMNIFYIKYQLGKISQIPRTPVGI